MARSRVYRRKSHHKRKGSKRPRTRRNRSRRMRGGVGEKCGKNPDGGYFNNCGDNEFCNYNGTSTGTCQLSTY